MLGTSPPAPLPAPLIENLAVLKMTEQMVLEIGTAVEHVLQNQKYLSTMIFINFVVVTYAVLTYCLITVYPCVATGEPTGDPTGDPTGEREQFLKENCKNCKNCKAVDVFEVKVMEVMEVMEVQ